MKKKAIPFLCMGTTISVLHIALDLSADFPYWASVGLRLLALVLFGIGIFIMAKNKREEK